MLYPLKFHPILKKKIWGGERLAYKSKEHDESIGESWEISAVEDNISVVSNGILADNDLQELIEVYMGDLVGDHIYEKFGVEFPLLIKYIDANDDLSIQVHPDDETAKERHNAYGKTEMWYIVDADKDASLVLGFNHEIDKATYLQALHQNKLMDLLNVQKVKKGEPMMKLDLEFLSANAPSITSPILDTEVEDNQRIRLLANGEIKAGEPLFAVETLE